MQGGYGLDLEPRRTLTRVVDFKAFISGCAGKTLSDDERRFFAATRPCGLILFARNCDTPAQLRALIATFKDAVGSDEVLVLIDQEGGRVQRLKPPHWRNMPPARCYGRLYETDREAAKRAAFAGARLTAQELYDLGINVNTMPVLDVPQLGRARDHRRPRLQYRSRHRHRARPRRDGGLSRRRRAAGDQACAGPRPGQGRQPSGAAPDRRARRRSSIRSISGRSMRSATRRLAMTAHVLLPAFDDRRPASTSPVIMAEVIRDRIGLTGLVMSDDLGMKALGGPVRDTRPRRDRGRLRRGASLQRQA